MTKHDRIRKLIGYPVLGKHLYVGNIVHYRGNDEFDALKEWSQWHEQLINRLAESARVIYSNGESAKKRFDFDEYEWANKQIESDTNSAILLDIQPLQKGVTKDEIIEALRTINMQEDISKNAHRLADRIEKEGIL